MTREFRREKVFLGTSRKLSFNSGLMSWVLQLERASFVWCTSRNIPRNIVINGVKCRVWYKGQPLVCDICPNNNKAADCPLRGKWRRCHQAGYFERECPKRVRDMAGREDTPSSASSVAPLSGEVSA